ncbi:unnamed protein product, partial [Rotaria sp. Silwood1]
ALTLNKRCREQVIPENQSFDESDYAGKATSLDGQY